MMGIYADKVKMKNRDFNTADYWTKKATELLLEKNALIEENIMLRKRLSELSLKLNDRINL